MVAQVLEMERIVVDLTADADAVMRIFLNGDEVRGPG